MNYTYLCQGDKLPSVGVLQKLLNRAGAKLDTDGIFGPKTRAAVLRFQAAEGLAQDGIVGQNTWEHLCKGLDLPIVDCVDVFDSFQREELRRAGKKRKAAAMADSYDAEVADIRAVGGNPFVLGGMSNGVEQAVSLICSAAKNAFLVRFHSHGYPGSAGVTAGSGGPNERNRINADSIPLLQPAIVRLHRIFGPYGSVEFMSCKTGRGVDGRRMVTTIATLIGVPVSAGLNTQYSGGTKTFRFEGPTYTAVPGGQTLKSWCRALPNIP